MVDKIKVQVAQRNAQEYAFFKENEPLSDYLAVKGVAFENSDDYRIEKSGGVIRNVMPNYSVKLLFSGGNVIGEEIFNGFTQTTINRIARNDFTYTGDNLTNESIKIYDTSDGTTVLNTVNIDHNYSGNDYDYAEVSEV